MGNSSKGTAWAAAVAVALFGLLAVRYLVAGVEAIDDAYISFRYARNLLEGAGLVYNPGEAVQGYTNFLWVILVFVAMAAGLPPVGAACAMGFVAGAVVAGATAAWSWRRLAPGSTAAAVAPVLLLSNMGLVVWSLRGLETALFTCLVLLAGLIYLRRGPTAPLPVSTALLLGLATLTRPEGALVFLLTGIHLLLARLREGRRLLTREDLAALGVYVGMVGMYGLWATWYYGEPLPNTFHAKVGGPLQSLGRGIRYLGKFVYLGPVFSAWFYQTTLAVLLLPLALLPRKRIDYTRSYAAIMTFGFVAYVVMVGGDVFPAYRFLIPIFPFLYMLVGDGLAASEQMALTKLASRAQPKGPNSEMEPETRPARLATVPGPPGSALVRLALALILAFLALTTYTDSDIFAWAEWRGGSIYTRSMRMVGVWLRDNVVPGTWIAVNPAGALPYESRLPTIDMLGLNDREIGKTPVKRLGAGWLAGHEKGNGESVFRRRPGIILIGGVQLDKERPGNWVHHGRSERELALLPELRQVYQREHHRMPSGHILTFLRLQGATIYRSRTDN